jgi:hypothetical protein
MIINCNINKLHDEFIKAGIKPYPVFDLGDGTGDFTFSEGTDMNAVQVIIDAHNPVPTPQPPTAEQRLESAEAAILALMEVLNDV